MGSGENRLILNNRDTRMPRRAQSPHRYLWGSERCQSHHGQEAGLAVWTAAFEDRPVVKKRKLAEAQQTPKLPSCPGHLFPLLASPRGSSCIPRWFWNVPSHDVLWPAQEQGDTAPSRTHWLFHSVWGFSLDTYLRCPRTGRGWLIALPRETGREPPSRGSEVPPWVAVILPRSGA